MSFVEKLDAESLAFFNTVCEKPFSGQAVAFLNAYWEEVGSQAEFIFGCAYETMKYADMHAKGISLYHLYEEGNDMDLNIGLYFYEQLCKNLETGGPKGEYKGFDDDKYKISQPEMMTAIHRKKELKEKVDVNFDGKVSMIEYLLCQYQAFANPSDFTTRSMKAPDEHPEVKKARLALEEVNKRIKEYEAELYRLTEASKLPGVKGLTAKNQLAQIESSPLKEELNMALIKAEAAVRKASKLFGGAAGAAAAGEAAMPTQGAMWWMSRDLEEKQKKYGKRKK